MLKVENWKVGGGRRGMADRGEEFTAEAQRNAEKNSGRADPARSADLSGYGRSDSVRRDIRVSVLEEEE